MAEIPSFVDQFQSSLPDMGVAPIYSNESASQTVLADHHHVDSYSAFDDEIPTVDYSLLFSDDSDQRLLALECLRHACLEYGFFYLVNHTIPHKVFDSLLKEVSYFFDPTTMEERKIYHKKRSSDKIRWDRNIGVEENREYLKVISHPELHVPSNPLNLSKTLEEYSNEMRNTVGGLARAVSKTLGFEENYIEKALNMESSGFDVMAINLYPSSSRSEGAVGIPEHTDPGFVVTLMQDINGGLQVLSHKGKWINIYIPPHAILIQLGDHLEILTNGKYKSHIHRVIVDNNKMQRTSIVTLHGPSLDKFISPSLEFVDDQNLLKYSGMTYKESLRANGGDLIDVQSSLQQLRLA